MKTGKALSSEERTILANIESLVDQLRQMDEGVGEGESVEESTDTTKEKSDMDINEIKRKLMEGEELSSEERLAIIQGLGGSGGQVESAEDPDEEIPEEGYETEKATASDSAEDRVADNQEDTTSEATGEVGDNMKQIVRAVVDEVNKNVDAKLSQVQKTAKDNSDAIHNLLDGMGMLKEVEKAAEEEESSKVEKSQGNGVVTMSDEQFKQILGQVTSKSQDADPVSSGGIVEPFEVRKSTAQPEARRGMAQAMGAIFGVNNDHSGRF